MPVLWNDDKPLVTKFDVEADERRATLKALAMVVLISAAITVIAAWLL